MRIEPGATLDRYRLVERIGTGGMGVVWKATDLRLEREVAIKLLSEELSSDPEALAAFEREARAIAALNHPNIVTIHSVEEVEGLRFFTMELLSGRTLRELIPARGMETDRLLEIGIAVADALAAAHERGVVHRDLKPVNVMITAAGQVKILDFGLARFQHGADAPGADVTAPGAWMPAGTLHYMSPEQIRGRGVDARSDLFALGVLLYEMMTGRRPFEGQTVHTLTAAILMDAPIPPCQLRPELPRRFDAITARCLEKDRALRPASAREVRELLAGLRGEVGTRGGGPSPSVAVLPFDDMSREHDQDHFCEGLAEELISRLTQVPGLRVASRLSSFQFKGTPLDAREIGQRLGVRHLLGGSVRKSESQLRVTVELTDVEPGFCLWTERYDRAVADVFALQEEIAGRVAEALELTLSPSQREALHRRPTTDVQAYEFYLRGRQFFYQYSRRGIEFARRMFEQAIALDPGYALAHAGLADCCTFLFMYVMGREEMRDAALEAARRAAELAPDLAQARVSLGLALSLTRDHTAAEREFEIALRLDPRLFEGHYFYARDSFMQGKLEEAARLYEEASVLRPEDYQSPLLLGQIYEDLGRPEMGGDARRRGLRAAETRVALHPDDVRALYMGANALVALGERERGLEWAQRAFELEPEDAMVLYNLACISSMAGRPGEALDFLERSARAGMNRPAWLRNDSNLDPIRDDPRFARVLCALEGGTPPATG